MKRRKDELVQKVIELQDQLKEVDANRQEISGTLSRVNQELKEAKKDSEKCRGVLKAIEQSVSTVKAMKYHHVVNSLSYPERFDIAEREASEDLPEEYLLLCHIEGLIYRAEPEGQTIQFKRPTPYERSIL